MRRLLQVRGGMLCGSCLFVCVVMLVLVARADLTLLSPFESMASEALAHVQISSSWHIKYAMRIAANNLPQVVFTLVYLLIDISQRLFIAFKKIFPITFPLHSNRRLMLTMNGRSRLALSSIFIICSIARALIPNFYNISSLSSPPAVVHCTADPRWLARGFPSLPTYESMCFAATQKATMDLRTYSLTTEYEFLDRGATAQTTRPKISLPRKYVAGMWPSLIKALGLGEA